MQRIIPNSGYRSASHFPEDVGNDVQVECGMYDIRKRREKAAFETISQLMMPLPQGIVDRANIHWFSSLFSHNF